MKKSFGHARVLAVTVLLTCLLGCKFSRGTSSTSATSGNSTSGNNSSSSSAKTTVAPPNIAGKYNVTGGNPNGSNYRGTLEVIAHGDVYQFRWNAGTQYDGVGVQNGKVIAVAFANGSDGKGCGVVDYDIANDGSLSGKWGYWGVNDAGTESATRSSGTGLNGEYDATGKNPNGKQYQAHLTVEPAGNLFHFAWSNNTDGIGIKRGDNV